MLLNREKIRALYWVWMEENLEPHQYTYFGRSEIVEVILSIIEQNDEVLLEPQRVAVDHVAADQG